MRASLLFLLGAVGAAPALLADAHAQSLRADGPPTRLLALDEPAARPVWSPDGTRLAFTRPDHAGLWVVGADGQGLRQVSDATAAGFRAAWSPDGRALLARTARYDGPIRLNAVTVFDVDAGTATALTDERALMPDLPVWLDADHVALHTDGALEVLALRPDAPAPTAARAVLPLSDGGLGLARVAARAVDKAAPVADGAVLLNVAVSPDGQRVAFEVLGGGLYAMNADGSGLTSLGSGHRPAWSPDGQWLAVMVTEDDGYAVTASDLVAVRADGSARVALTQTPDRIEMNPSWRPDGRSIAFDDLTDGALYLLPVRD